ncbi:hypothetical protein SAMN03159341_1408 [Paenibacillus sp. 1_12]|uniref:hypothetical protein n=1 Tax=Paenibacillus sp. 1_12 TaxID=1566278 RepID=UPI0008EBAE43|nr:hypothetical protein [Paenibacillus sp. 1_12]SFM50493.1 hypothetical protein SAMN03159341_1408 [Paenibacillus sp. 1_12]
MILQNLAFITTLSTGPNNRRQPSHVFSLNSRVPLAIHAAQERRCTTEDENG